MEKRVAWGWGVAHRAEAKPGHKYKGLGEQKCVREKEKDRDRIKAETERSKETDRDGQGLSARA